MQTANGEFVCGECVCVFVFYIVLFEKWREPVNMQMRINHSTTKLLFSTNNRSFSVPSLHFSRTFAPSPSYTSDEYCFVLVADACHWLNDISSYSHSHFVVNVVVLAFIATNTHTGGMPTSMWMRLRERLIASKRGYTVWVYTAHTHNDMRIRYRRGKRNGGKVAVLFVFIATPNV